MGYIGTGGTVSMSTTAYLTQRGRELLIKGDSTSKVAYFALGDSDANYHILNVLDVGYVPDITGNNVDCINTITNNIDIKYKITK